MDANDAVIVVGAQLDRARSSCLPCARLVARDGEILMVSLPAIRPGDILIAHLSTKDLEYGLSSPKWNHIESKIRELLLKGLL